MRPHDGRASADVVGPTDKLLSMLDTAVFTGKGVRMSTKSTLEYGENFHLYVDYMVTETVYLRLTGTDFVARPDSVTVAIPFGLWNRLAEKKLDPANWWDEEDLERPDACCHATSE
jgi:hypothetical protein